MSENVTKSLTFHRLELVFNLTLFSFPSNSQCLAESDKVLINFVLTLNTAMLAYGLWAIKTTNLTAGAKKFHELFPKEGL